MKPVNTRLLFLALLRDLDIDLVCDVGSMNGDDALAFRARLPRARIIALEPNPANLRNMRADPRLAAARIEIVGAAASNADARAPFFVVEANDATASARRGMSSLHRRNAGAYPSLAVDVQTLRLDTLLAPAIAAGARIALWIDVEGHACEVLEGLGPVARQVEMLHVELESEPCIAPGQRLYPEARALLELLQFHETVADQPHSHPQFNALFLRAGLDATSRRRVATRLRRAQLRRALIDALGRLCPQCRRRLGILHRHLLQRRAHGRLSKHPSSESATYTAPTTDR
jgi:FkbM family methyltransferase